MTELAQAVLIGYAVLAGTATDRLGEPLGGLSSLRWDAARSELVALPDRGPGDGTVPYAPRLQFFKLGAVGPRLELTLERTLLLTDFEGRPFSGLIESSATRLDPEGLALDPEGGFYVSEEYEPGLWRFGPDGRALARAAAPEAYLPGPGRGRTENQGLEGLCLTSDGRGLAALLQSPLAQDGGRSGRWTRLLLYPLPLGSAAPEERRVAMPSPAPAEPPLRQEEFAYNELEALGPGSYLLLERDNRGRGAKAGRPAYKRLVRAELQEGGSVARGESLDLLEVLRAGGVDLSALPPKFESVAWGPLVEGRRTLWLAVDNDFKPELPTYLFLLGLGPREPS